MSSQDLNLARVRGRIAELHNEVRGYVKRGCGCRKCQAGGVTAIALPLLVAAEVLLDIAVCGYRDIDPRIKYLEVQIDRDIWNAAHAALARLAEGK